MAHRLDGAIAERSRTQLGLIKDSQLIELGASRHQVQRMIDVGSLVRREPHVLRIAGAPTTHEQDLLAGLLALGPRAVVSHHSAAELWELDGAVPGAVELTVPRGHRNRLATGRVHSSLHLDPIDLARRGRFPVTTPARTLIDIAGTTSTQRLEGMVDGACRDRLTSESELLARLRALPRRGAPRLAAIIGADLHTGRPHNWLERKTLAIFTRGGGPVPRMQTELTADDRVLRVDGYFEEHGLVIEVAGHRTHSTRRQRQADNERRLRLEQMGLRVLEFTYEDVTERPDYVLRTTYARLGVSH